MRDQCSICKKYLDISELYEYRNKIACTDCFDKLQEQVDYERQQVIEDTKFRTDRFKGLDMSNSIIGKANREILKADIEIAKKGKGQ